MFAALMIGHHFSISAFRNHDGRADHVGDALLAFTTSGHACFQLGPPGIRPSNAPKKCA
jgi:hypothetical protein